jgi:hypothetical protein
MWAHANEPAPRIERAGAPEQLQAVVDRAMAKDPNERYLSAGDLAQAAIAAVEGQEVTRAETSVASGAAAPAQATAVGATRVEPAPAAATVIDPPAAPTTPAAPAPPPARRRPLVPIVAAVAGVIVIAVVAIVLASSGGGKSSNPATAKNGASRDSACPVSGGVLGSVTVVPGQRIGVVRLGEPRSEVNTDMGACRGASNFVYYAVGTNTMEVDFDGAGNVERVIAFPAPNFLYKNVSGQTTLTAAKRQLQGWSPTSDGLVSPDHKTVFVPYDNGANSNSGGASPGGFKISAKADY